MQALGRVERSTGAAVALRDEVMSWVDRRRREEALRRFSNHLDAIAIVFPRMLDGILSALDRASLLGSSGEVYERCRSLDDSLVTVRRAYEWYATKYDQRLDCRLASGLRAADEIVRSCWHSAFELRGMASPAGPLPYFDARFDSNATSRRAVPIQIKAPADAPFSDLVDALPIPVTALPLWATAEPWWLVLAVHETGHHVQADLGLDNQIRTVLAPGWAGWSRELFADTFSVLMVGAAAIKPVQELEHATPRRMMAAPEPGDLYPPPLVRLAILGELAGLPRIDAGEFAWIPKADEMAATALAPYFDAIPATCAALLKVLKDLRPAWDTQRVAVWQHRLRTKDPVLTGLGTRAAARYLIAAGVMAYAGTTADERQTVNENLLRFLPECGPPGTLGSALIPAEIVALADRLTIALVRDT